MIPTVDRRRGKKAQGLSHEIVVGSIATQESLK